MNAKSEKPKRKLIQVKSVDEYKSFCQQHYVAVDYLTSLIDDIANTLPASLYGAADSAKDKAEISRRFESEGLSFATLALPKLSEGLFQLLETGQATFPSFKIKRDTNHPQFLGSLFRLALSDGDYQVEAIRMIYQISVMFSKLKGPYPESVLRKQLSDFVSTDQQGLDIDWFEPIRFRIMERARYLISLIFKDVGLDHPDLRPRPGPGATNTPVAKHMRYRPHVLYTQIDNVMDYVEFFNVNPYDVVYQTSSYLDLLKNKVESPRSRFKSVHKKVGKPRGICMEENEMQWCQQALRRVMYAVIEKHPATSGKINFSKQCINAQLALTSSLSREYATIDMSEGSDRVFRDLVAWTFQDCEIYQSLMALSTRYIDLPFEVDGSRSIRTTKYAPMGSGLCFPVMSVIHWALCQSIIDIHAPIEHHSQEVYVYGDDIVVPSNVVELIYQYLPLFGMKLNINKSFYKSHFRESCGVHAYKGKEITPIYVKYLPVVPSYAMAMSCISVEHQLVKAGYGRCARLLRTQLSKHYSLPFVPVGSPVFGYIRENIRLVSGELYTSSLRFDSWGNPVKKHRVVVQSKESIAPPSEVECYLRHILTRDSDKCVDEDPFSTMAKWKRLTYSELSHKTETPFLKHFKERYSIKDERSARDIEMEAKYDFTLPIGIQCATLYPWYDPRPRHSRCSVISKRAAKVRSRDFPTRYKHIGITDFNAIRRSFTRRQLLRIRWWHQDCI